MIQLDVTIPSGYRATGSYNTPQIGEFYLDANGIVRERNYGGAFLPCIIVERIPTVKREGWINVGRYSDSSMVTYTYGTEAAALNAKGDTHLLTIHIITEEVDGKVVSSGVTVV